MNELLIRNAVIVGGGPAGLAPVIAACRSGQIRDLLAGGLTIVDKNHRLGAGEIGRYHINSDSLAETFLSCIEGDTDRRLAALRDHPTIQAVARYRGGAVPLQLIGEFLAIVGMAIHAIVGCSPGGAVLAGYEAVCTQMVDDGLWLTRVRCLRDGAEKLLLSRSVVLATGAMQPPERLRQEIVAGVPLLPRYAGKLMQSGELMTPQGLAEVACRLRGVREPKVAIIGGSQSALASAHALLNYLPDVAFGAGGVSVLHRRDLRVTYNSAAAAQAEGYLEFGPDDICPLSGRVFRLGGFRLESRELVMRARGIGGRPPEPRLSLHRLRGSNDAQAARILAEADLIVAALGYRPRALPVLGLRGEPIKLHAQTLDMLPMVDGECRVLDAAGQPLPQLFGIGLAAGFVPRGRLGGEPSFVGQANGLWLWQNDVGAMIVNALLGASSLVSASSVFLH